MHHRELIRNVILLHDATSNAEMKDLLDAIPVHSCASNETSIAGIQQPRSCAVERSGYPLCCQQIRERERKNGQRLRNDHRWYGR